MKYIVVDIEVAGESEHLSRSLSYYSDNSKITLINFIVYENKEAISFSDLLIESTKNKPNIICIDYLGQSEEVNKVLERLFLSFMEDEHVIKVAHNAIFDRVCLTKKFKKVNQKNWFCTKTFALFCGLPCWLIQLAELFFNIKDFKNIYKDTFKFMKLKKVNELIEKNYPFNLSYSYKYFKIYGKTDVSITNALLIFWANNLFFKTALENYIDSQIPLYDIDIKINNDGIPINYSMCELLLKIRNELLYKNYQEVEKQFPGLNVNSTQQLKKELSKLLNKEIKSIATDKIILLIGKNEKADLLINARLAGSKTSLSKINNILKYGNKSTLKHTLIMYGANTTGRWSGKYENFLNIPKTIYSKDEIKNIRQSLIEGYELDSIASLMDTPIQEILPRMMRSLIEAPKDYTFIVSDLKTIEPTLEFYITGDVKALTMCLQGDIYIMFASFIFNSPEEQITKKQRTKAKPVVLGCGYGMGPNKLKSYAESMGVMLTEQEAIEYHTKYHEFFSSVSKFHKTIQQAMINVLLSGKSIAIYGMIISKHESFIKSINCMISIKLISGRELMYRDVEFNNEGLSYMTVKNYREKLWGGKLVGHIVQATARDVFCEVLKNLNQTKYFKDIVFHVYDSIICKIKESEAEKLKPLFDKEFSQLPIWLTDFPGNKLLHESYVNKFFL